MKKKLEKILPSHITWDEYTEADLELLWNRRNTKRFKLLLRYNCPNKISILIRDTRRLKEIGARRHKDAFLICYGEKKGTERWESIPKGVTLYNLQQKYGDEEGERRFNEYRNRQAYTNSKEYKNMSQTEFDEFNKSRAVTLYNLQQKYGDEEGERRFNEYRNRQAYTNSKEYLGDRYEDVNKRKALTLDNFISKYGDELGTIKYSEYMNKASSGYSKISQVLFHQLTKKTPFIDKKCYFAECNNEYGILYKNTYKKYDFTCPDLNIIIEFHGDHYHGNPKIYKPEDFLRGKGCTKTKAKDVWEMDKVKADLAMKERGFMVIVVWESEYKEDPNGVIDRIIKYVSAYV